MPSETVTKSNQMPILIGQKVCTYEMPYPESTSSFSGGTEKLPQTSLGYLNQEAIDKRQV